MKVLIVFGTRPEAIKMAPVVKEILNCSSLQSRVLVTAQHREMLNQVLSVFDIIPDYDLNLMHESQGLVELTSKVMLGVRNVLEEYNPNIVLVHGDTTTAMATALAAFYLQIPVGHIEAGLRTGDLYSPWPEELNRRFVGMTADLHFAPTQRAKINLLNERVDPRKIFVTGNTVVDALSTISSQLTDNREISKEFDQKYNLDSSKKLILVTGHRRESFGAGFERICHAISTIAARDDVQILYPVHLNPNVQKPVLKILANLKNVHLIAPLEYLSFVYAMHRSYLILTDSGGIQEEAPSLGKPLLLMRNTTERPEGVETGSAKLVGTDIDSIVEATSTLLDDRLVHQKMMEADNPYGDGHAAPRILKAILSYLNL